MSLLRKLNAAIALPAEDTSACTIGVFAMLGLESGLDRGQIAAMRVIATPAEQARAQSWMLEAAFPFHPRRAGKTTPRLALGLLEILDPTEA